MYCTKLPNLFYIHIYKSVYVWVCHPVSLMREIIHILSLYTYVYVIVHHKTLLP